MRTPRLANLSPACLLGVAALFGAAGVARPVCAAPAPIKSLAVEPAAAVLDGARASRTLIVTGTLANGAQIDLTAEARFSSADPKVTRIDRTDGRPRAVPAGPGGTTVTVQARGLSGTVRISVKNFDAPKPVSFLHEVIPALTKAGCSMGTCHGTPTGKGGFRLSLQGYNPEADFITLTQEGNRRVNRSDPGRSLVLLKPLMSIPHAGGKRLTEQMAEYRVLSRWIAEGARADAEGTPELKRVEAVPGRRTLVLPDGRLQVAALAHFSDGSVRDVTEVSKITSSDDEIATVDREGRVQSLKRGDVAILLRYEHEIVSLPLTILKPVPGFVWKAPEEWNYIDRHVNARLKLFQIPASPVSEDTEFLRRVYLDVLGRIPTGDEARTFLSASQTARKTAGASLAGTEAVRPVRAKLVDHLLKQPEFADFWALKWADVLRIQDETLKDRSAKAYHKWVRDSLFENKPLDRFARELITADGGSIANPPANYYRTLKEPNELAEATTQLFLGVRMACARCHNHPFERWTQDEYYQFAAFFAQVDRRGGGGRRGMQPADDEMVVLNPKGEVTHLRTGKVMQPRLLGAGFPTLPEGMDRRVVLAEWMTRKDNPFFGKALANRVWANLLGRGIVEPIDDFRESNPPLNGPLLDAMGADLAANGFDLHHLMRSILNSRTYQASSRTVPGNQDDEFYYSHSLVRTMSAEQLADSISQFTGVPDQFLGYPEGTRATQIAGTKVRTPFLKTFGRPDRNLNCECEREKEPNLFQALSLLTGRDVHRKLRSERGKIAVIAAGTAPLGAVVEDLYLSAFSRPPTAAERRKLTTALAVVSDRRAAIEDLAWALINAKEFLFRH